MYNPEGYGQYLTYATTAGFLFSYMNFLYGILCEPSIAYAQVSKQYNLYLEEEY